MAQGSELKNVLQVCVKITQTELDNNNNKKKKGRKRVLTGKNLHFTWFGKVRCSNIQNNYEPIGDDDTEMFKR